jgi:hypothetical protein
MGVMWRSCEGGVDGWSPFFLSFGWNIEHGFCFEIPIRRHTLYQ